jgi:hypothetical protein
VSTAEQHTHNDGAYLASLGLPHPALTKIAALLPAVSEEVRDRASEVEELKRAHSEAWFGGSE